MRRLPAAVAVLALACTTAACGGGGGEGDSGQAQPSAAGSAQARNLEGVTIEVAAKWTGEEQANFQKVLDAFQEKTGAKVTYASTGEDTGAYLGPRIQGGNPPDIAILPQPGLVAQYAKQNALKPLSPAVLAQID